MIAKSKSLIPLGFTASLIEIEGDLRHGLPGFNIVGMAAKTVCEARERVKSALHSSGFIFPNEKLTISLAPADLSKQGAYLDLAIAVNILITTKQLAQEDIADSAFVGELSLDGRLRPVKGIVNIAESARDSGLKRLFIPVKNLVQASLIKNITLIGISSLEELYLYLKGQVTQQDLPKTVVKNTETDVKHPKFSNVSGQDLAKRALMIAVAGRHNILLSGPPGTGKTMLAKAALNLLPPLSPPEQISVTKLYSLVSLSPEIITSRPFRAPHHTASLTALIGGGPRALPGEVSLASGGALFLDELPEFPRNLIESLRQPLEDHQISISRAGYKITYPADFMLIATMNPCPCGYLGDTTHPCTCTQTQIANYQKKLSGPLLDRIDLFVDVGRVDSSKLLTSSSNTTQNDSSSENVVKNTITSAINAQNARFKDSALFNSSLSSAQISQYITLSNHAKKLLDTAASSLDLSARSYFKIIRVARTIADLDSSTEISPSHLSEALSFRRKHIKNMSV